MAEKFKVVEIFESINGEGMRAGELAVFVRMQGCNLCCNYCDTAWANVSDAEYREMTIDEIMKEIAKYEKTPSTSLASDTNGGATGGGSGTNGSSLAGGSSEALAQQCIGHD